MLTRLVKPPKDAAQALKALNISAKNSDGTMKPLSQTLQELRKKFSKLSDSQKSSYAASIAGQEAMSGMLAIVNASDSDFEKLTASINNADGASKQMADTMNDNVKGAFTLLKSNVESVGIKLYDKIKEPLKKLINAVSKYVSQIPTLLKNVYNWVNKNKEALKVLVKVIASVTAGFLAYKAVLVAINTINMVKNFLNLINPVGLVVAGIATLTAALVLFANKQTESEKAAKEFADEMKKSKEAYEEYNKSIDNTTNANLAQIDSASRLKDELKTLVDENGNVKKGYESRVDFILNQLNEALGTEYTRTGEIVEKYKELQGEIDGLIEKKRAQIILQGEEEKYKKALEEERQATEDLKKAEEELGMTYAEAKEEFNNYWRARRNQDLGKELTQKELDIIKKYSDGKIDVLANMMAGCEDAERRIGQSLDNQKNYEKNYELFINEEYDKMGNTIIDTTKNWTDETTKSIKEAINEQSKNLESYTGMYERTGSEVAKQNAEQAQKNLENLANELVARTKTIGELGEEEKQAWKTLGEESYENYCIKVNELGPTMGAKIQEATGIIAAGTPEMQSMAGELGRKTVEEFDKSADAKQKALNIMTEYLNEEKRKLLSEAGIENVDAVIQELDKKDLSEGSGRHILEGLYDGLQNKDWKGEVLGSASGLAKVVHDGFNDNVNGLKWGSDLVSNIANGLKSKKSIGEITASAAAVAGSISDYLHHTVPEKGPLKNDDEWMFDMMDNFAKGMDKGLPKVIEKSRKVAKDIKNSFEIQKINDEIYRKMQNAVARENASITAKATLEMNKSQPLVIARDHTTTINNTQQFYSKDSTPYEEQKQAKQQLRRLAYGL